MAGILSVRWGQAVLRGRCDIGYCPAQPVVKVSWQKQWQQHSVPPWRVGHVPCQQNECLQHFKTNQTLFPCLFQSFSLSNKQERWAIEIQKAELSQQGGSFYMAWRHKVDAHTSSSLSRIIQAERPCRKLPGHVFHTFGGMCSITGMFAWTPPAGRTQLSKGMLGGFSSPGEQSSPG